MSLPILYVKAGCPWCQSALEYFDQNNIALDVRDVLKSKEDMKQLIEISGQQLTPTLQFEDFMVPDFSVDEFKAALSKRDDMKSKLGFK